MTPKQEERIRTKITRIRKELAADKKRWGGFYNDGRGLRYLPPGLFVKLKDYKGGLRYLRWFGRTLKIYDEFPEGTSFEALPNDSRKYRIIWNDRPFIRISIIELSVDQLRSFVISLANYLAQPIQKDWDGITIKELIAA